MKIGFFDSGLGGLIILKAVAKHLPQYDYEFYGDTANLPYGDKSEAVILALTKQGIFHLFDRGCSLVIVACNTASAETLRTLQDSILTDKYQDHRILGVIIPTVEEVIEARSKRVCVLATKRTIDSGKYEREFAKFTERPEVIGVAESRLVPLIESNEDEAAARIIKEHVIRARAENCDALILGCTHFSLFKDVAREVGWGVVTIYSQDEIIPQKIENYLARHPEITSKLSNTGKREIVLTEHKPTYDRLTAEFLGGVYMGEENQ